MKKIVFILSSIFVFLTFCYSSPEPLLVNRGHWGPVNDLKYDGKKNLLFSAGDEGNVCIWDPGTNQLVSALPVSRESVQQLAIHPKLNQVAIVESKGNQAVSIRVWDWEKKSELYMINLSELPIFFGYSLQGTYLMFTQANWQSLGIYDSQTGRKLDFMSEGFGIVSFLTTSVSEKNIMTYQPSGRISYWELQKGKLIKTLNTASNLTRMCITQNMRYMAAATSDKLSIIDLLNGDVKATTAIPDLMDIRLAGDDKTLICLTRNPAGKRINLFNIAEDKLTPLPQPVMELGPDVRSLALSGTEVFLGDGDGNINAISFLGDRRTICENRILPVSGIAITENNVFVASEEGIIHFTLDLDAINKNTAYILNKTSLAKNYEILPNPFKTPVGLTVINKNKLAIWDKSEQAKGLVIYDLMESKIIQEDKNLTSALIQVSVRGDNLLLLEKNGQLRILNINTLSKVFSYFVPGMNRAVFISDTSLVGGKAKTSIISEPLIRINLKTGETVPLSGSSILNYDLIFEPDTDRLYSISVEKTDELTSTNILMHYGKDYEQKRLIMRFPNEDFTASLVYSPETKRLYTSLGYNLVQSWDTSFFFFSALEKSPYIPRKLEISQDLLIALNDNYSLTVWELKSQNLMLNFFLFKGLDWVVVFPHNANSYSSKKTGEDQLILQPAVEANQ